MKNITSAAIATILSVAAGLLKSTAPNLDNFPTRATARKRTLGTSDEARAKQREIAEWNAAVDARKLAKKEKPYADHS